MHNPVVLFGKCLSEYNAAELSRLRLYKGIGDMIRKLIVDGASNPHNARSVKFYVESESKIFKLPRFDFVAPLDALYAIKGANLASAFEFVCGSSGSGKTQLMWSCPRDRKMIYIPLRGEQTIYSYFAPLRDCLFDCLNKDVGTLSLGDMSCDTLKLHFMSKLSYVAGFFKWAMEHQPISTHESDPAHLLDRAGSVSIAPLPFYKLSEHFARSSNKVIVALDEVNCREDPRHLLLRNLLRIAEAKLVILSTHHST